jgi:prevent-host-death family protein
MARVHDHGILTIVMRERTITATQFKAQCLALLDEVAERGIPLVVTKHGEPVARVEPAVEPRSMRGTVTYLVSDEELIAPLDERWDALE